MPGLGDGSSATSSQDQITAQAYNPKPDCSLKYSKGIHRVQDDYHWHAEETWEHINTDPRGTPADGKGKAYFDVRLANHRINMYPEQHVLCGSGVRSRFEADIVDSRNRKRGKTYVWDTGSMYLNYVPDYQTQPRKVRGTLYRVNIRWRLMAVDWAAGPGPVSHFHTARIRCSTNLSSECKFDG